MAQRHHGPAHRPQEEPQHISSLEEAPRCSHTFSTFLLSVPSPGHQGATSCHQHRLHIHSQLLEHLRKEPARTHAHLRPLTANTPQKSPFTKEHSPGCTRRIPPPGHSHVQPSSDTRELHVPVLQPPDGQLDLSINRNFQCMVSPRNGAGDGLCLPHALSLAVTVPPGNSGCLISSRPHPSLGSHQQELVKTQTSNQPFSCCFPSRLLTFPPAASKQITRLYQQ